MRKVFACFAPLFLAAALLCGCSVSEMSTLRELSRPYTGEYACETLTYAGRDLLEGYEYIRLTLDYGGEAKLGWKKTSGGEGERRFDYRAEIEEGRIAFTDGAHTRTFAYEDGAVCIELILCGRLLYARFAM